MDMLLHRSFELDCEMGRTASVLIPQEAWLFDFYAQFGYAPTLFASDHRYKEKPAAPACPLRSAQGEDLSAMDLLFHAHLWDGTYLCRDEKEWRKQLELFTNAPACPLRSAQGEDLSAMDLLFHAHLWDGTYLCRDEKEWRKQLELFTKCGGEVLCTGPEGAPDGYAFVWCSETQIWAQELVCSAEMEQAWVAALMERYRKMDCTVTGAPDGYAFVWCSETQIWAQELVCSAEMEQAWVAALMERYRKMDCTVTGLTFASRQPLGCVLRHDGTQPMEGYMNLMLN